MKFSELKNKMKEFNSKYGIERKVSTKQNKSGQLIEMVGVVVLSNKVLNREYPIEQRTYKFSNYNKALTSNDMGYSIFSTCDFDGDVMRIEDFQDSDFESAEIASVVE